ncbi:MAG: hypothetical protein NVSMB64_15850 [Candidatus Velthaea sp.]
MSGAFEAFDLNKALRLTGDELDALPYGVIVVDAEGTILEYNLYERSMAHMGTRPVVGKNFFRDVAPCTAIRDFQGRFADFMKSDQVGIEPFEFLFSFAHAPQRVNVTFIRLSNDRERATICVIRSEVSASSPTASSPPVTS